MTEAGGLRRRLAGLVCVALRDFRGGADAERVLAEREELPWAGYNVFGGDLAAVRDLLARITGSSERPLLLASDLERGLGQQLAGGTSFPPPMTLGAAGDPELAREVGRLTGREAGAAGLNAVFAPVLDLACEPENPIVGPRAFGDDPRRVAELGAAFVRGLQEGGVLATAKHFPGHGRTRLDSHSELPTVAASRAELGADLLPFRRAVDAGAALVMTAHVAFPALETGDGVAGGGSAKPGAPAPRPATLSRPILTGLLREEMGFRGAVVSDALIMGGVAGVEPAEAAARALEAGVDCLLDPPEPPRVVAGLARRLERGALALDVVERAEARLRGALARAPAPRGGTIPAPGAAELALRAARAGVTVVRGEGLPWRGARSLVLIVLDGAIAREDVVLPAAAAAPGREFRWVEPASGAPEPPPDLDRFADVGLAWFSPVRAWKGRAGPSAGAAAFARRVLAARPDATLISFSSPAILHALPAPRAAILAFGEVPACQIAVGEVLAGETHPAGRLPVRL